MYPVTTRSRICRLFDCHREIDALIRANPDCPRNVSQQVDRLLLEAESIRAFYLR